MLSACDWSGQDQEAHPATGGTLRVGRYASLQWQQRCENVCAACWIGLSNQEQQKVFEIVPSSGPGLDLMQLAVLSTTFATFAQLSSDRAE